MDTGSDWLREPGVVMFECAAIMQVDRETRKNIQSRQ